MRFTQPIWTSLKYGLHLPKLAIFTDEKFKVKGSVTRWLDYFSILGYS